MQIQGRESSPRGLSTQSRTVAIIAILLFAISGLVSGFAVGAFVRIKPGQTSNSGTTPIVQGTAQTVTATPTEQTPDRMGTPHVTIKVSILKADGNTPYQLSAYATDHSYGSKQPGIDLHTSGITFKLWLTKDQTLPISPSNALPISTLQTQVAGEIPNSLHFDPTTEQIQTSKSDGQIIWKFTVDPGVQPDNYFLSVVADWKGQFWNIFWVGITVPKPNQ